MDFHSPAYVLPLEEVLRLAASRASGASARIGTAAAAGLIVMMVMTVLVAVFVMMVAVDSRIDELAPEPCFDCRVGIAFGSGAYLQPRSGKSILGALSHASADQGIYAPVRKQISERLVARAVRVHEAVRYDLSVLDFIDLEFFRMSEMLENISVFVCYRDSHVL